MKRAAGFSIIGFVIGSVFSLFVPFLGTLVGVVVVALLFAVTATPRAILSIGIATILGAVWPMWVFIFWLDGIMGVVKIIAMLAAFFAFTTLVARRTLARS